MMATPDQIPSDLTLDIGDDLAPAEFVAAVRNFFGYVQEIAEAQGGEAAAIRWSVKVKEGSTLVGLVPSRDAPKSGLSMIYEKARSGAERLARGEIGGAGLSEKALGHIRALSDLSEKSVSGRGVNLWVRGAPVHLGGEIAKAIKGSLERDYHDFGTLEGRLEAIQDANDGLKIRIKDLLYPKPIPCVVPERMIETVFKSFRKRVEIEGRIHYRPNGTPIGIEASRLEALPEDDDLPSAGDVRGILAAV